MILPFRKPQLSVQLAMERIADHLYKKYPFLDSRSALANHAAIYATLVLRDYLIDAGYDPAAAVEIAMMRAGDKFVEKGWLLKAR